MQTIPLGPTYRSYVSEGHFAVPFRDLARNLGGSSSVWIAYDPELYAIVVTPRPAPVYTRPVPSIDLDALPDTLAAIGEAYDRCRATLPNRYPFNLPWDQCGPEHQAAFIRACAPILHSFGVSL